ncbi:MAG TPA: hypothetical protein ENN91_05980 [Firmicutes bacterium]|nr:hypothetical protein [Bacillota bacterium]
MAKNLFLLGKIGTGKSTLLRNNLLPVLDRTGGFFVQRVLISGVCTAFRLLPVTNAEEYLLEKEEPELENLDNLFLKSDGQGNWHNDLAVFRNAGIRFLQESAAEGKRLILLDEIGGVELSCVPFVRALKKIISGSLPVIGVLKAPVNAGTLEECLAGGGITSINRAFINELRKDPFTELNYVDRSTVGCTAEKVKCFVEAAVK